MSKKSREAAERLAKLPVNAKITISTTKGEETIPARAVKEVAKKYLNVGGARKGAGRPRLPDDQLSEHYRKYGKQHKRKEENIDDGSEG